MEASRQSPLGRLAELADRDFPSLFAARERSVGGLKKRRDDLGKLSHDAGASIVLMGSWGRAEVTTESDDDFMVLVYGEERAEIEPSIAEVSGVLDNPPGSQGIFAAPVYSENLVQNIGLDDDNNRNLSRRMLFLLDREFRRELQSVSRDTADDSAAFSDVRRIGKELQAGLLALLYEPTRELSKVTRDYMIF